MFINGSQIVDDRKLACSVYYQTFGEILGFEDRHITLSTKDITDLIITAYYAGKNQTLAYDGTPIGE